MSGVDAFYQRVIAWIGSEFVEDGIDPEIVHEGMFARGLVEQHDCLVLIT